MAATRKLGLGFLLRWEVIPWLDIKIEIQIMIEIKYTTDIYIGCTNKQKTDDFLSLVYFEFIGR